MLPDKSSESSIFYTIRCFYIDSNTARLKKTLQNILLYLLLLWSYTASAQSVSYRLLTIDDGLPSNTVYQIKQDKKGFIWLATANGLARYDGRNIKLYNPKNIKDKDILGFIIDDNKIWFWNLTGELYRIQNDVIKKISFHPKSSIEVKDFVKFKNRYFFISNSQAFILSPTLKYKSIGKHPFNYFIQDENRLFLKDRDYIYEITNDKLNEPFKFYEPNFGPGIFERLLFYRYNEQSWCLRENSKDFYKIDDSGSFIKTSDILKFTTNNIRRFYQDNQKLFWCITPDEIIIVDASEQHLLHRLSFEYADKINGFFQDSENNYWLPLNKKGVAIITSTQINTQKEFKTLDSKESIIYQLYITKDNNLLISINDGKVINKNLKNDKEQLLNLDNKYAIYHIKEDFYKNIWIVSSDNATVLSTDLQQKKYKSVGKNIISYKSIYFDSLTHNIFIGNYGGVLKIPQEKYQEFVENNINESWGGIREKFALEGINHRVYSIGKVKNSYWLGSTNGLYEYDNKKVRLTTITALQKSWITHIINQSDTTWVATQTDGLFQIVNKKIINHYNEENGLISNNCKQLIIAQNGIVWVGTNNGINKINTNTGDIDLINKLDGLSNNNITALATDDKTIYVGTPEGLTSFDKNIQTKNTIPPPIYFSSFQIFEKDTILSGSYTLKHDENNIRIGFTGISFRSQGMIRYKYRMLGLSNDWSETTSDYVSYPVLNPDDYTFEVVAINEDGVESTKPIRIHLTIRQPFWATWWFQTLLFAAVPLIIWSILKSRINRLKVKNQYQQKINELEMQALHAQMNPHFIFNVLNSIQHYLMINDGEKAMIYLSKFAKLIRMIFDFSRKQTISLYEEINFLNLYMEMEKLRFKQKLKANLTIDEDIFEDEVQIPPLLIQPIIENCFKHGLLHKETGGEVNVNFKLQDNSIICIVEDNGIGREAAKQLKKWKKKTHKSAGVNTTKERLELWLTQKYKEVPKDAFKILDLVDENDQAIGTRVEILLQIKS